MSKIPLLVLAGPTASGKSALALELAEQFEGTIIAADSRTVYRGFDVGTAKPSSADRARVPHELIDVADPTETYTAARFKADAQSVIQEVRARGRFPMIVGGTGFYIRALAGGLEIPEVPPQPALREKLRELKNPHARLAEVDPPTAARLHPNDLARVIRALEVYEVLGKPLSEAARKVESPFDVLYLVLGIERLELHERIQRRTRDMVAAGLVPEVVQLLERYGADLPLLQTLGYGEILPYLQGHSSLEAAIAAISLHTRQYAKRQLTWFKGEPDAVWLRSEDAARRRKEALELLGARFAKCGREGA